MLSHSFVVVPNMSGASLSQEQLLDRTKDAQALMVGPSDVIDRDLLRQCPTLKIVASTFSEPGMVDVHACSDRGVWLSVAKGSPAAPMAALEAAANIFEALTGRRPKGAVNSLRRTPLIAETRERALP